MPQEFVFHESFDSVRARSLDLDPDVNPALAQVQAESLLTLLLGRSITINNGHAFDSRGVLHLLNEIFESAAAVASRTKDMTPLELYRLRPPVIVRRHRTPTLLSGCISQLTRLAPGDRFILSAWQRIDDNDPARRELARILERVQGGAALSSIALPGFIRDDRLASQQLSTLERLHHYLQDVSGVDLETVETHGGVADRVRLIQDKGTSWLVDVASKVNCPEDHAEAIYRTISHREPDLVNRTWVYGPTFHDEAGDAAPLVRELVDTLYNAQIARSTATVSYLSTPPRGRNVLADAQVNELALAVATNDPGHVPSIRQLDEAAPMSGIFETVGTQRHLNARPLPTIFQAYWELIAVDEQRQAWQRSCDDVNRLLRERASGPGARFEFAEAWDNHLALLRGHLRDALFINGGAAQLAGEHDGASYLQSHEPGRLQWASLEDATAAGEYLDMLSLAAW
jgi:hypothetical protein